jgi:hypothetical protein
MQCDVVWHVVCGSFFAAQMKEKALWLIVASCGLVLRRNG